MVVLARVSTALFLPVLLASTPARAAQEPAILGEGKTLVYLQGVHGKVHANWALNFLAMAETQLPKDDPINSPVREVTLEVVLAPNGSRLDTRVLKSSSVPGFDSSAIDVLENAPTFPLAPEEVLSDDGKVHLYWVFARDHRQCSGITVAHKEAPLSQAMPALVRQGRDSSAIARLKQVAATERLAGLSAFAQAWLTREATSNTDLGIQAVVALARGGSDWAGRRLSKEVPGVPEAAEGLAALAIPVCPLIQDLLAPATPEARQTTLRALRYGASGECLSFLETVAKDSRLPVGDRVMAIEGLKNSEGPDALATLRLLLKAGPAPVLAAAILAEARPGAGKGAVFRLIPKLKAPALPVRAAAAAALVRVGGEANLAQLFMLFKEKDPDPYQRVAAELAALTGKESATMLTRFLKKNDPRIRLAAVRALAHRTDEYALKALAQLGQETNQEIRLLAQTAREGAEPPLPFPLTAETRPTFRILAEGKGRPLAAQFLLEQFASLDPGLRIALLGDWLAASATKK